MEGTLLFKNTCTQQRINGLPYRIINLEGFWSHNTSNQFFNPYTSTVSSSIFFFLFSLSTSFSFLLSLYLFFFHSPPLLFHILFSSFTCFSLLFFFTFFFLTPLLFLFLFTFPPPVSHTNFTSFCNIICLCCTSCFASGNLQRVSVRTLLQVTIYNIYPCANRSYYWRPGCYLSSRTQSSITQ